ncbi:MULTISPECIES: acyl carrier protein [unclassified Frankia]|uniref:acyl carrier protein n=1 Tax=unclassified Frankia TaxID=2632575 RepID=UPI002024E652
MSATHEQIVAVVTDIVTGELGLATGSVTPSTDLRSIEGADSVKVLRMISRIEQRFDVELEDEDVFGVSSVHDIALVVAKALIPDPS